MILLLIICICLTLAFFNAVLFVRNLLVYSPPPQADMASQATVSVLIPARNEENAIGGAVLAALASRGVDLEVIVLDDHSEDRTAAIVSELTARDRRVRLERAPALPPGWCGKQFACWVLSGLARHDTLCFLDSDVRLRPDGLARMIQFQHTSNASLVSGFPQQELVTFFEKLLLPMMHFLLLSYLPIDAMRKYFALSFSAGCGQVFVARRDGYMKAGGHAAIRGSRHDGIALPKVFRRARLRTDLCDATSVATCRMYRSASEVFSGLLKNANEGIAAPVRIFVFTGLLLGGHLLPTVLFIYCLVAKQFGLALALALLATLLSFVPRLAGAVRFRQPIQESLLHPFAVAVFLALQWYARFLDLAGAPAVWKGRTYRASEQHEILIER